jgi:hypothetical protein
MLSKCLCLQKTSGWDKLSQLQSSPKDHPDRSKMYRFSAKLRKLGLREETIGYGPSKEKWEEWNQERT